MKRYLRFLLSLLLSVGLMISLVPLVAFADHNDLLIASESNANLMTLELLDDGYGVSTYSTLGTVTNTIEATSKPYLVVYYYDDNGASIKEYVYPTYKSGRWYYTFSCEGPIYRINHVLYRSFGSLPSPGTYDMSFDFASDFSFDYSSVSFAAEQDANNVALNTSAVNPSGYWERFSGDIYISPISIRLGSLSAFLINVWVPTSQEVSQIGGSFSWRFVSTEKDAVYEFGVDTSMQDYQTGVSGSLGDLSSSVGEMTDEISEVADAIDALRGAMEPHYDNMLTQLHHITEQLHAFWDQLYNMFYLPQYARLGEILNAIQSADTGSVSNLTQLKQTVEKVTSDIMSNDNKLSSDQIANDEANTEEIKDAVEEHGNFIIEGLKGLFIPSDEFFKSYFDDLFSWFSDRFGFLSLPIDLLAIVIDLFVNSSSTDCVLTLPSFQISGEQLLYEQSFNLTDFLEENFMFILSAIRMLTSIGLIMAFVNLCSDKWNEVMRN